MPKSKLYIIPEGPPQHPQPPNNLPIKLPRLVGREREVEAVCRLLSGAVLSTAKDQEEHVRLLTLVGPGGVGKTRLALQVAAELLELEEFPDGVYFVELASIMEADQVVPTIATILQVREVPGTPLLSTLVTHLQDKTIILTLDNFEQIVPAGPDLAKLLAGCPDLKLLVTSRAGLGLRNETEFLVSPLAMPQPGHHPSTDRLLEYGAIELFALRAKAQRRAMEADFELTNDNADAVVEICRRVDGLPLAIELVAAHARLLSPQSILARLMHPLRLLTKGPQDAPSRQRTMRDTIEWSYRLLNVEEQRLFRRLAVFVGGFSVRAAEAICNEAGDITIEVEEPAAIEVLEGLEALVDKSLLGQLEQTEDEDQGLTMLETVREYAWNELVASGEAEAMRRQHANYYVALAEQAEAELVGKDLTTWLHRLDRDHDNLRAVLTWLLEQGETRTEFRSAPQDALRLILALRDFWQRRTHSSEQRRWLEKALKQIEDEVTPLRVAGTMRVGNLLGTQGSYLDSRAWAEQSLAMARELGDKWLIAEALSRMANAESLLNDLSAGRSLFEEALALYRELGDDDGIARTLINLGEMARHQGEYEDAMALYLESKSIFSALEEPTGVLVTILNLGHTKYHISDFAGAKATYLEAATLANELDVPGFAAGIWAGLCAVTMAEIAHIEAQDHSRSFVRTKNSFSSMSGLPVVAKMEHVTRLSGLVAGLLEKYGRQLEPWGQDEFDRNVTTAREWLGEEAFTKAWEEGQAMTLDQALQFATQGDGMRSQGRGRPRKRLTGGLTTREYEVAALVTQGLSNEEIALALVLSERTVETYVSNALHKLGLTTRTQLAAWAVEQGLAGGHTGS